MSCEETSKDHIDFAQSEDWEVFVRTFWTKPVALVLTQKETVLINTHVIRRRACHIERKRYVNFFFEVSVKQRSFYIHLMDRPSLWSSDSENCTNWCHFSPRSKHLIIVNTIFLVVTKSHKSCLITVQEAIRSKLNRIKPFTAHEHYRRWARDYVSCLIHLTSI